MKSGSKASTKVLTIKFEPHPQQREVMEHPARFKILACGRRWGKTTLSVIAILTSAWENKGSVNWWIAPSYRQSKVGYRILSKLLKNSEIVEKKSENELYIRLINDSIIEFKSAERPDNLHGEGLKMVVMDEAARVDKQVWYEVLRPALADTRGKAMIISTPKGKNWFYEEWLRGFDDSDYKSWQFPTYGNPYISREEIEKMKAQMPELEFREQILAEFIDASGTMFSNVRHCVDNTISIPVPPKLGMSYVAGVDLARYEDFTVITVLDNQGRMVYFDRFNDLVWNVQIERIKRAWDIYKPVMAVDSTGPGDIVVEHLRGLGLNVIPYRFTAQSKEQLLYKLMYAIERQMIRFPFIPQLIKELESMRFETTPTGATRFKVVSGHDDCVMSLALAAHLLRSRSEIGIQLMRYAQTERGLNYDSIL